MKNPHSSWLSGRHCRNSIPPQMFSLFLSERKPPWTICRACRFIPGGRIRIPAMVFCALACFLAGIGVEVIGMYGFDFHWEREPQVSKRSMGGGGGPGGGESKKGGDGAGSKGEDKKEGNPDAKNRS